ncbi:MAG TPA: carbon starvation CstA family protein [Candidatus Aminicenantes bacterium]|nr:carbon starvation CstA family protein [Candidatus Aminicenantes bacterium]HRY66284.1 carbon starvation CstA family protein [Candidatus Aminicenantes bacterium]HRZ73196.1 carbon starvation CstA family protein [Candidatus Aminicenantes bacterium]
MNVLVVLLAASAVFILAGRFYSRYVARHLGEDAGHPTPAVTFNDGRDYVPTKRFVVFAHHFSAIAGAGPILGPTMAILYGFGPAWLWVVFGGVFIGAVHDYTTLFISMREGGKSMAEVARKTLGGSGFRLFIAFTIVMIVLVTSSFLSATSISLTSVWPLAKIGVEEGHTFLKTVVREGVVMGRIGGIASTSVIVITLCSPLLGFLLFKKNLKTVPAYFLAAAICVGSILMGIAHPVTLAPTTWMLIISGYVLVAAGVPVWLILQPRDFINVQILYGGIVLMIVSLFSCGFQGLKVSVPTFNLAEGASSLGFVWPMMFITIACGAISGFHCLVAGGTTCKQLSRETDARTVGYNAMLLESLLSVCVLLALGAVMAFSDYKAIVWPTDPAVKSNPILGFSLAAGRLFHEGLGIPVALGTVFGILLVEGFVITTLDAAVRLNRYLFEELWAIAFRKVPRFLKHYWVNSGISVLLMWVLAYSNAFNALWPIFGTANQLLAAMALLTVSAWLLLRKRRNWFTLVPAAFMVVTTLVALGILLAGYLKQGNFVLIAADLLLFALSAGVVVLFLKTFLKKRTAPGRAPAAV